MKLNALFGVIILFFYHLNGAYALRFYCVIAAVRVIFDLAEHKYVRPVFQL